MHKRWFLGMFLLCTIAIAFSCIWLVSPVQLAANYPTQTGNYYLLVDSGGYVSVLCVSDYAIETTTASQTDILVNLLSEQDALRIKAGYSILDEERLAEALNALRSGGSL